MPNRFSDTPLLPAVFFVPTHTLLKCRHFNCSQRNGVRGVKLFICSNTILHCTRDSALSPWVGWGWLGWWWGWAGVLKSKHSWHVAFWELSSNFYKIVMFLGVYLRRHPKCNCQIVFVAKYTCLSVSCFCWHSTIWYHEHFRKNFSAAHVDF